MEANLSEDQYQVLEMLVEGWRIPQAIDVPIFMKPGRTKPVPGGVAVLVSLRDAGFLDDKNRITEAGKLAFKEKRPL